jgi:uncharacterized protein (DUF2225 family)
MTTLLRIQLTCPVCARQFGSQAVLNVRNAPTRKRTDFDAQTREFQLLPYLVHTCSRCGYTGCDADFGSEAEIGPMTAAHVWDELAPKLPAGPLSGSEKYEFAAKVAAWQGADLERIGQLLLCAAWCCVNEGDVEAERYFRRHSARMFELALAPWDGVPRETRAQLTYLVGELWRRVGDLRASSMWFDRVPSEIVDLPRQRWIITAAAQQRDDPQEWFGGDREIDHRSELARRFRRRSSFGKAGPRGLSRLLQLAAVATRRVVRALVGVARPLATGDGT